MDKKKAKKRNRTSPKGAAYNADRIREKREVGVGEDAEGSAPGAASDELSERVNRAGKKIAGSEQPTTGNYRDEVNEGYIDTK